MGDPGLILVILVTPAVVTVFAFVWRVLPRQRLHHQQPDADRHVPDPGLLGLWGSTGARHIFYYWNPFTYFLEIVRVPIITGELPGHALLFCSAVGIFSWVLALLLLGRFRKRLAFIL